MLSAVMLNVVATFTRLRSSLACKGWNCVTVTDSLACTGNTKGGSITVPLTSCLTVLG